MTMLPHTYYRLATAALKDLRIGQSTAAALADRLRVDQRTAETLCARMLSEGLVESLLVADCLAVFKVTPKGHDFLT